MGLNGNEGSEETEPQPAGTKTPTNVEEEEERVAEKIHRTASESSIYATEDEDEDDDDGGGKKINLGPQCTLKEHLQKDKVLKLTHLSSGLSFISLFFRLILKQLSFPRESRWVLEHLLDSNVSFC